MNADEILILALFVQGGSALLTAALAANKGRSYLGWLLLGLLFGPLTLLVIACLGSVGSESVMAPINPVDELERLSALREKGSLTEAEYQTAKAKVLWRD